MFWYLFIYFFFYFSFFFYYCARNVCISFIQIQYLTNNKLWESKGSKLSSIQDKFSYSQFFHSLPIHCFLFCSSFKLITWTYRYTCMFVIIIWFPHYIIFRSRNNNSLYTSQWWCTPTWFCFALCSPCDVLSLRIIASVIYLHVHNAYLLAGLSYSAHILWICLRTCIWCPRINTYKSLFYDSYLSLANNLSVSYVLPLSYTYLEIYVYQRFFSSFFPLLLFCT